MSERVTRATAAIAAVALLSACSFSPVNHRIKIGEESFVVFVAEGIDHHTDLFGVPADGGSVAQITFTPLIERGPRLSADGEVVAFLRMHDTLAATHREVVLMNLVSGGEVSVSIPPADGNPEAVAWSRDGRMLHIRTDRGDWQVSASPSTGTITSIPAAERAVVDSELSVWLGEPRFARAVECAPGGLCTIGPSGDTATLAPKGRDPIRWGTDSVAWFESGGIIVRSLGPGRERRVNWTGGPDHPREGSYAGVVNRGT